MKPLSYFLLLAATILMVACGNDKISLVGTYETHRANNVKILIGGWRGVVYPYGTSIELRADSMFTETNCGNIITGTWQFKNDGLEMFPLTNEWKSDSIETIMGRKPRLGTASRKVAIDGNKLVWEEELKQNGETFRVVCVLVKKEDK